MIHQQKCIQFDKSDPQLVVTEILNHKPEDVDVTVAPDGRVWVNYQGVCILRIGIGEHIIRVGKTEKQ